MTEWEDTLDSYKKFLEALDDCKCSENKTKAKQKLLAKLVEAGKEGFYGEYCCGTSNGEWCTFKETAEMGKSCKCYEYYSKSPIIISGIICPDTDIAILLHR